MSKTFISIATKTTKWLWRFNVWGLIYVLLVLALPDLKLPVPFKANPEFVAKLLGITSGCLTALLAELKLVLDIELFSGPEVAAIGYAKNFCFGVAAKKEKLLYPCYIFIPENLSEIATGQLSADTINVITNKKLNCAWDGDSRVYVILNPANNKKVFLDLPSTLKTLGELATAKGSSPNLEIKFIRSFKKHLQKRLGIKYKKKGLFRKFVELIPSKKTSEERDDSAHDFDFTNTKRIFSTEPFAGFRKLE